MDEESEGMSPAEINASARRMTQTYIKFGDWKPDLPGIPPEEPKDESPKPLDPSFWRF